MWISRGGKCTATMMLRRRIQPHHFRSFSSKPVGSTTNSTSIASVANDTVEAESDVEKPDSGRAAWPLLGALTSQANQALEKNPRISAATLLAAEMTSVYGTYSALGAAGIVFPAEFALAFALNRPLRRLRLPLDLAVSAAVARAVPPLRTVRRSALSRGLPPLPAALQSWMAKTRARALMDRTAARTGAKISSLLDRYGLAYLLSGVSSRESCDVFVVLSDITACATATAVQLTPIARPSFTSSIYSPSLIPVIPAPPVQPGPAVHSQPAPCFCF